MAGRKPARSRQRDGKTTGKHLLEAAGRIFAEFGYGAASAKTATERAGLSPPSANRYFGGKKGLYEAVLREATRRVNATTALKAFLKNIGSNFRLSDRTVRFCWTPPFRLVAGMGADKDWLPG